MDWKQLCFVHAALGRRALNGRPLFEPPKVEREFTSEGVCVDRVIWHDPEIDRPVESVTMFTDQCMAG